MFMPVAAAVRASGVSVRSRREIRGLDEAQERGSTRRQLRETAAPSGTEIESGSGTVTADSMTHPSLSEAINGAGLVALGRAIDVLNRRPTPRPAASSR
jgi:hypothetical protein